MPHLNWLFGIEQSLSCAVLLLILLEILLIQYLRYFVDYQWWHGGLYKHCLDLYSTEATSLIVDEANKPKCACLFTDYSRCLSVFFIFFCETWWLQTLIKAFLVTSLDHKTVVLDKTAKQKCFCHLLHCRGNIPVTSASLSLFCTITASSKGSADAMTEIRHYSRPHVLRRFSHPSYMQIFAFLWYLQHEICIYLRVTEQTGRSALAPLNLCTHYDIPL